MNLIQIKGFWNILSQYLNEQEQQILLENYKDEILKHRSVTHYKLNKYKTQEPKKQRRFYLYISDLDIDLELELL